MGNSDYLTHEEVRALRKQWEDLFKIVNNDQEQTNNLRSLSGKRWGEIIQDFLKYKDKIVKTPISANIRKELNDLKRINPIIEKTIITFKKEISELRSKNTDIVDGIVSHLISLGEYDHEAIKLAKEDFYKTTATNYSIIFNTHRPIGEYIESMSTWDISKLQIEVEADIVRLTEDYTRKLSANI